MTIFTSCCCISKADRDSRIEHRFWIIGLCNGTVASALASARAVLLDETVEPRELSDNFT